MNVAVAASLMNAKSSVGAGWLDREIEGFAIDSRSVKASELFFALSPPDYLQAGFNGTFADAHQFIPQALERGALAAVARAERVAGDQSLQVFRDRLLLVPDCIVALQTLAHGVYQSWARPVVGITGSAGKTTAKELTAQLLAASGRRVLKSEKNYNNGLGHPLSVLQMVSEGRTPELYDVAVLEMGMSSPMNEIARLCSITPPDVGVELLVAPVHLEHLGTIEKIAAAKAELIEGMKPGGTAVLNADDERVMAMRSLHSGPVLTFGIENRADVFATEIETGRFGRNRFRLHTPRGSAIAELSLPGRHNLMNALAAAAVGVCFEIEPELIADSLRRVVPAEMRGGVMNFAAGFDLIDDSYNSNPRSLLSMVRTLQEGGVHAARRIVIAGEMLELGEDGALMHREAGAAIARSGVDVLWGVRGLAQDLIEGARASGMPAGALRFFERSEQAAAALMDEVRAGDLVLVKGSRGVRTDKIVKLLRDRFPLAGADER